MTRDTHKPRQPKPEGVTITWCLSDIKIRHVFLVSASISNLGTILLLLTYVLVLVVILIIIIVIIIVVTKIVIIKIVLNLVSRFVLYTVFF